jgi:membrane-associated protein
VRAEAFFLRFGVVTIFIARFVPIVRTVAPVMAGVSRMKLGRFVVASVLGGIAWTVGIILLGYWLGHFEFVRAHKSWIDVIVLVAIGLSLVPTLIHLARSRRVRPRRVRS